MSDSEFHVPPGFTEIRERNTRLIVRAEMAEAVAKALHPLHQAWVRFAQRRFTAQGRAGVVSVPLGDDYPSLIVRRYRHGGLLAGLLRSLYIGPDRAVMELAVSETARLGGMRTPRAVGVLVSRVLGPFRRLAIMTEEISDSEDLVHYCCRLNDYPPETAALEKRGAIREAARQIRKMHDIGIVHADLHLKNLLLRRRSTETPEMYVIDFDRAFVTARLTPKQRLRNLKRLARSVRKVRVADAVLTAWDKIRFLRAYLEGMPDGRKRLRIWARKLAKSGIRREVWWAVTRAKRNIRGDGLGRYR